MMIVTFSLGILGLEAWDWKLGDFGAWRLQDLETSGLGEFGALGEGV